HIGEIAHAGFHRAVDVADDARGLTDRGNLHGLVQPTGLGGVDRNDLGCVLSDDLDHVVGVPGRFIRHYRRVDRPRHLRDALDSHDGLLDIDEVAALHSANGLDGLTGRRVALTGIHAQGDVRPYRPPDRRDDL